jgi:YD repeat-containing protein
MTIAFKVWTFGWNANDWRTQATDPNRHASLFGYDAGGRLTSWTNALQKVVSYQHNQLHRLTNIVGARNNALGFAYQDCCADRLTAIYYAASDLEQFTCDPAGNLANYANRAGETVRYYYDAASQMTNARVIRGGNVQELSVLQPVAPEAWMLPAAGASWRVKEPEKNNRSNLAGPFGQGLRYSFVTDRTDVLLIRALPLAKFRCELATFICIRLPSAAP